MDFSNRGANHLYQKANNFVHQEDRMDIMERERKHFDAISNAKKVPLNIFDDDD